jgi:hypothetical protein
MPSLPRRERARQVDRPRAGTFQSGGGGLDPKGDLPARSPRSSRRKVTDRRTTCVLKLQSTRDGVHGLRALPKAALRKYGLRCVDLHEEGGRS